MEAEDLGATETNHKSLGYVREGESGEGESGEGESGEGESCEV